MKRIVLAALLSLGVIGTNQAVYGQTISTAHDTVSTYAGTGIVDVHNAIINLTASPINISWQSVSSSSIAANWNVIGICDDMQCYGWNGTNGVSNTNNVFGSSIAPSANMDLKLQLDATAGSVASVSWVTLKVWDNNNPSFVKNITYIVNRVPVSVSSVVKADDNIILYPNPAKADLNVVFDANAGVKNIAIYNLIGKPVSVFRVAGNSAKLNVDNIPSGIYFVRLLDAQGRIVSTRKFTHQ
jgi:hypothetical protein